MIAKLTVCIFFVFVMKLSHADVTVFQVSDEIESICLEYFKEEPKKCLGEDTVIISKKNNNCIEVKGGSACSIDIDLDKLSKGKNRVIINQQNNGTNIAIGNASVGSIVIE